MGYHWVISPVISINGVRTPLVGTLPDPGRPMGDDGLGNAVPKTLAHSTIYHPSLSWCLSLTAGIDTTQIDLTAGVTDVLGGSYSQHPRGLLLSLGDFGFDETRLLALKTKLQNVQTDGSALSLADKVHTPIDLIISRLGHTFPPGLLKTAVKGLE